VLGKIREGVCQGRGERGVVSLRPARGEGSVHPGWIAEAATEGTHQVALGLDPKRAADPGRQLRIDRGDERVCCDPHRRRCRVEEPEVPWAPEMHLKPCQALHGEAKRIQRV
jgi:hypothetical protein